MDTDAIMQWAAMGQHGFYVWLAYGVSLVVLLLVIVKTRIEASGLKKELELDLQLKARESGRTVSSAREG
ncbi:MAG: heme exporter protein CcmD [Gammaproteobacteria bacterium]|nr:heme exporter protein CcmD [Gammaproteobacteria bacterium]